MQNPGEVVLGQGNFSLHVGRRIDGFEGVRGGYGIGKINVVRGGYGIGKINVKRRLLKFCDEKKLCVANTRFEKKQRKKHTVWVEIKLRLILFWLAKTIESI